MAREDVKAKIRLEGDAKGATAAIKKTEKGFKRLGGSIKKISAGNVIALAGVVVGLRSIGRAIGSFVAAAQVQEDAINALDGALSTLGPSADRVSKALQAQAAALQQVTKYGDEEIIQAQALIGAFVKEQSAIEAATKASLDLATAKGFSLVTAADLVSKTLGSSTNALTRYGIEVTGAVGSTERLASLTENIAAAFGGRAALAAETFSGKVEQLKNAIGDAKEEMGFAITENEGLIDSLGEAKTNVEELTPALANLAAGLVAGTVASGNFLVSFGELIVEWNQWLGTIDDGTDAIEGTTIAQGALENTAANLGITVEQLKINLAGATERTKALDQASRDAADALDDAAGGAEDTAENLAKLDKAAAAAQTAMEKLGASLDVVTSAKLSTEILEIETNLEAARVATGGFGEEFERLEDIAKAKITNIEERIVGLKEGFGDLGDAIETTGDQADATGESFEVLSGSVRNTNRALSDQARQARITSGELVRLTAVNETLALAEARTALAATQQARKRITGTGGRSQVSDYGLSEFGTGGRGKYSVEPDGTIRGN